MRGLIAAFILGAVTIAALSQTIAPVAADATTANVDASLLARFRESGRISRVDATNRLLVINDGNVEMAPWLRVYADSGRPSSVGALRPGMTIAFNWSWRDPKQTPVVTEILILSESRH